MQFGLAFGKTFFRLSNPLGSSEILPEPFIAEAIERLSVGQHSWVSLPGGAEFMSFRPRVHIVEDFRLKNLYSGEHQLANRTRQLHRYFGIEESADPPSRVNVHRAVLVGIFVRSQN